MSKFISSFLNAALLISMSACVLDQGPNQLPSSQTSSEEVQMSNNSEAPVEVADELVEPQVHEVSAQYKNVSIKKVRVSKGFKYIVHFKLEGIRRNFIVYEPDSAKNIEAPSLVFMLHGTSGNGEKFYNISGWVEVADKVGTLVVFPSALTYCFREDNAFDESSDMVIKITSKWDDGGFDGVGRIPCTREDISSLSRPAQNKIEAKTIQDDVKFLDQIITFIKSHRNIDESKIFVSGFSNGAGMSARLSAERQDTYAMFAAHGGGKIGVPKQTEESVTLINTIGSRDDRFLKTTGDFPYVDENDLEELPMDESLTDVNVFKGFAYTNTSVLNFDSTIYLYQEDTYYGQETISFIFDAALDGKSNYYQLMLIDDNTHSYPNGKNHPFKMAEFLWEKFTGEVVP